LYVMSMVQGNPCMVMVRSVILEILILQKLIELMLVVTNSLMDKSDFELGIGHHNRFSGQNYSTYLDNSSYSS